MHGINIVSPIGFLRLEEEAGRLTALHFLPGHFQQESAPTALLREGEAQLNAYFRGALRSFDLPLCPAGTAFQRRVWDALLDIPYGTTESYGHLAKRIAAPGAARAVGGANHINPLPVFIPCHRVIGADGTLTGYGGGLCIKKYLLMLEGAIF